MHKFLTIIITKINGKIFYFYFNAVSELGGNAKECSKMYIHFQ